MLNNVAFNHFPAYTSIYEINYRLSLHNILVINIRAGG